MLNKRNLGHTGIKVSELALGTVKFGRNEKVKYPSNFDIPNDEQAMNILSCAKDIGINLLDTAPAYGIAEERLGSLLKGQRNRWIISSKAGEEFIDGTSNFNFTPEHIIKSTQRSLSRLKTDYIDIMMIHSDGNDEKIIRGGALDTLEHLKKEGLIRATGMSTKTINGGLLAIENSDVVMITYNPWHTEEKPIIDKAKELNKGILIKKVLNSGNLGKSKTPEDAKSAIQFALSEPSVSSLVIGSININHIKQNALATYQD
jgi:aryl-alcohol dehydrogenase-like predicted oxidoreductase